MGKIMLAVAGVLTVTAVPFVLPDNPAAGYALAGTGALCLLAVLVLLLRDLAAWLFTSGSGAGREQNRVSMVEVLDLAREQGWDLLGDAYLLFDIVQGLKQAAAGGMKIYGREGQARESATRDAPLSLISRKEWIQSGFEIQPATLVRYNSDGEPVGFQDDNVNITCTDADGGERSYFDIHVDRKAALKWLKKEAGKYKGMSERIHVAG